MIDEDLHAQLAKFCVEGKIARSCLTHLEPVFIAALDKLGIAYRETDATLELESPLALLNFDSIRARLDKTKRLDDFEWHYKLLTESTNADALQLFGASRYPCITLAEMQTGGRGRRGRQWLSPFAKNIYCTIGMSKSVEACNPGLLSIVTGIALVEALAKAGIDGVTLKWPNDLYCQNRKLGGILIESKMIEKHDYFFAIGFGINVAMDVGDFSTIPQPSTSVERIVGPAISRDTILVEAIQRVVKVINGFDQSLVSHIVDRFNAIDAFRNQTISVIAGDESISGLNRGINAEGQLQLETGRGRQVFSAADISLRAGT